MEFAVTHDDSEYYTTFSPPRRTNFRDKGRETYMPRRSARFAQATAS